MRRSPFRDSRNQKLINDSRQSTDLKVFNFPMTEILTHCRVNPSCKITIDTDKDSWVVNYDNNVDNKTSLVVIKGKAFDFDTRNGKIKLSGGIGSLNLMLKYILRLLNAEASEEKIKQRCKTINKKITDYLGEHDHADVPIQLLEEVYEKAINSERIDQCKVTKSPRKELRSRTRNSTTAIKPAIVAAKDYKHNDDVFTLTIPDTFALAPSKYIKTSNEYGIFTKKKIKKGETIGVYTGVVCFMETKKKSYEDMYRSCYSKYCKNGSFLLKNDRYDMAIGGKKVIDASIQNQASFIRYINTGFPNHFYNNCSYAEDNGIVEMRATRDIYPGEEILCDYGINSESNVLDKTVLVQVISINPDETVTFTRQVKDDPIPTTTTLPFDDFRNKYYHILTEYLKRNKKMTLYRDRMKAPLIVQEDKYTVPELETYKDTELTHFLTSIKKKLDALAPPSKIKSDLKRKHYYELLDYYENKKSRI